MNNNLKKITLIITALFILSACQNTISNEKNIAKLNEIAKQAEKQIFGDPNNCYFMTRDALGVYLNTGNKPYELNEEIHIKDADPYTIRYAGSDIFYDQRNAYVLVAKKGCEGGYHEIGRAHV